jgi:uncharacterized membrane-anchored protein
VKWRVLIGVSALIVLGVVNNLIMNKERIKRGGEIIYVDLAPRDPRSLMQGDYMTLRFRLADEIMASQGVAANSPEFAGIPRDGESRLALVSLNEKRIASATTDAAKAALKIRYRMRNGQVWLGTNAFFFQEGDEPRYAKARYGEFRVDRETGEAVLVALRDESLRPL